MRQVVHIFKKDFHCLWSHVLRVLILTGLFAWSNGQGGILQKGGTFDLTTAYGWIAMIQSLLPILLPIAWWYLIAAVISQEALPGEEQFWLTRPYSRPQLATAKILFILAFVNLPMLVAHCVILHDQGFPVLSHVPGLLLAQLMIFALWLMPAIALAVACRNLWQFLGSGLVSFVVLFISAAALHLNYGSGAESLRWCVFVTLLAVVSLSILIWQYWQRRTALAWTAVVCGFLLALIIPRIPTQGAMWDWQLARSRLPQLGSAVQIVFEPRPRPQSLPYANGYGGREVDLPLRVTGLPDETELWADYVAFTIESHDGTLWKDKVQIRTGADATHWQTMWIDQAVLDRIKNEPVTLHVSAYLTLTKRMSTTRLTVKNTLVDVPDWGRCSFQTVQSSWQVWCLNPFRTPGVWTTYEAHDPSQPRAIDSNFPYTEHGTYLPLPEQVDLSPLTLISNFNGVGGLTDAILITTKVPVARSRRDFEIRDIHLADYEAHER